MIKPPCPIATTAIVSARSLIDRATYTAYGALADNQGEASVRYASMPAVEAGDRSKVASFLGSFVEVMGIASRYRAYNLPVKSVSGGAVMTQGMTEPELATFDIVMRRLARPVWVEFEVGETNRGSLCIPLPDRRAYMFLDVVLDRQESVCGFFPYFTETVFPGDGEPERGVFDPIGVFDRLAAAEAQRFGLHDAEDVVDMMTKDADAAMLAICSLDYASTVTSGDPATGCSLHAGRDASVEKHRRYKGLEVW